MPHGKSEEEHARYSHRLSILQAILEDRGTPEERGALIARLKTDHWQGSTPVPPTRRGITDLLSWLHDRRWPPDEEEVRVIMHAQGEISRDDAIEFLSFPISIRVAIEAFIGVNTGNARDVALLYQKLQVEFGIQVFEADRLLPIHLGWLVGLWAQTNSPGADVQDALRRVSSLKSVEESSPLDPDSSPVFLKATRRFPAPETSDADEPSNMPRKQEPEGPEAEPTTPPELPRVSYGRRNDLSTGRLTPGARAIGAAMDILKAGGRVTLQGACKRAGVDRGHLRNKYPDAVKAIKALGQPDRQPRRGITDRRTGDVDGVEDDDD